MEKRKWLNYLINSDSYIASLALIVLVVLTSLGVFMRYIVGNPFTWLEEVQLFCMVWIVFQGGSVAFKTHNHVAIEMVVEQFPLKIQTIIMYLVHILVILILGYLFYQSLGFISLFIRNGRKTSMLNIPMWLFYIIAPISICEMIINYINSEYKIAKEFKENKGVENE